MPQLRPASIDDCAEVSDLFLECWAVSYLDVLSADVVAAMDAQRARELWTASLTSPVLRVVVGEDPALDHRPLGVVSFRPERDGLGYLSSLYVSPRAQGTGIGGLLLRAAEDGLREAGMDRAHLWVFTANRSAGEFYERRGWRLDGAETTLPEWGAPQVGMSKMLLEPVEPGAAASAR